MVPPTKLNKLVQYEISSSAVQANPSHAWVQTAWVHTKKERQSACLAFELISYGVSLYSFVGGTTSKTPAKEKIQSSQSIFNPSQFNLELVNGDPTLAGTDLFTQLRNQKAKPIPYYCIPNKRISSNKRKPHQNSQKKIAHLIIYTYTLQNFGQQPLKILHPIA